MLHNDNMHYVESPEDQEEEEGTLILDEEIDENYEPTDEGTLISNSSLYQYT